MHLVDEQPAVQSNATPFMDGSVARLGGIVPVDGRLSWAPPEARGFQPVNCYLVTSPDRSILIDTGMAVHEREVVSGLASVLPKGRPFSIFLTRSEYECIGNLGPIAQENDLQFLMTGGLNNPFDAFDDVSRAHDMWDNRQRLGLIDVGEWARFGLSDRLFALGAPVKILNSYWAFDKQTGTLFSSDFFPTIMHTADESIFAEGMPDAAALAEAREHMLAKFYWLKLVRQNLSLLEALDDVFENRTVNAIAPTHGRIILGDDATHAYYRMARETIIELTEAERKIHRVPAELPQRPKAAARAAGTTRPHAHVPREFTPGIWLLGACIENPDAPVLMSHYHMSNYLIVGDTHTMMIDTGMPTSWDEVSQQLDHILGDRPLDFVMPTHPEYPHSGNLGRLLTRYPEARGVGDVRDFHTYYPEVADRLVTMMPGETLDLGGGLVVDFVEAILKDLPSSIWAFERRQKVLFVGDGLGISHVGPDDNIADPEFEDDGESLPPHGPEECALMVSELARPLEAEGASFILRNALVWSRYIDSQPVLDQVYQMIHDLDARFLAPAHSNVIDEIDHVFAVMRRAHEMAYTREAGKPSIRKPK